MAHSRPPALADDLDTGRQLEDAGAAAIVLRSFFEEQIVGEQVATHAFMEVRSDAFAEALSYFPDAGYFHLGPEEYLEHLRRVKTAVAVPVIASLNGTPRFSGSSELLLRLRWIAILAGRFQGFLAVSGGVHTATDAIKAVATSRPARAGAAGGGSRRRRSTSPRASRLLSTSGCRGSRGVEPGNPAGRVIEFESKESVSPEIRFGAWGG